MTLPEKLLVLHITGVAGPLMAEITSLQKTTIYLTAQQALDLYAVLAQNHQAIFAQWAKDLRAMREAQEGQAQH